MLAENEYAWQTIRKNTKRINIYRDLQFKAIQSPPYIFYTDIVKNSGCIYTTPNETSVISIQTLTTDDDGYTSRLTSDDSVQFGVVFSTTTSAGHAIILKVYLKNKKRYEKKSFPRLGQISKETQRKPKELPAEEAKWFD